MRIAVDIAEYNALAWKVAAGALEYETDCRNNPDEAGVSILLPHSSFITDEDKDPSSWDGAIVIQPRPEYDIPQVTVSSGYARNEENVGATVNNHEVGRLAVAQFVSMGLSSLAFYGRADLPASTDRWSGFSEHAKDHGIEAVFISSKSVDNPGRELPKVPKPCGILAFNDDNAFWLLKYCSAVGLQVPRDIHLIGVDNTPACMESTPTLSSISMPFGLVGYHAARLCAMMIKGESVESMQVPPSGLIIRDSIQIERDDIRTAAAIAHYVRSNLKSPIQMEDVVRRSSISRRRLEQIFRSAYGVSPMAYLRELRFERAKKLLQSTDAPLKEIVKQCGYSNAIHLCHIFKKTIGQSPMQYREAHGA